MTRKQLKSLFDLRAQGLVLPLLGHIKSREFAVLTQKVFLSSVGKHVKLTVFPHILSDIVFDYQTAV